MYDLQSLLYPPSPQPAEAPVPEAAQPVVDSVAAPMAGPATAPTAQPTQQPIPTIDATSSPEQQAGFMERMRTDPNLRQSILMTGLTMMQPQHGESTMGLIGRSIMAGNATKQFLDQNVVDADIKAKEAESVQGYRGAQTKEITQNTEQKREQFPLTYAKLEQEVSKLRTEGKIKEAEAKIKAFESDEPRMLAKHESELAKSRGQTNSWNAAANDANSRAADRQQEHELRQIILTSKDPDQVKRAKEALDLMKGGGRGATSAMVQNRADLLAYYEDMYPNETVAQRKERVLKHEKQKAQDDRGTKFSKWLADNPRLQALAKTDAGFAQVRAQYQRLFGEDPTPHLDATGKQIIEAPAAAPSAAPAAGAAPVTPQGRPTATVTGVTPGAGNAPRKFDGLPSTKPLPPGIMVIPGVKSERGYPLGKNAKGEIVELD